MKKKIPLILAVSLLIVSIATFFFVRAAKQLEVKKAQYEQNQSLPNKKENFDLKNNLLTLQELDIVSGSGNAPVTIIEYASYSCGHCSNFYKKIYPTIKRDFIEKGKVFFILRDFPLDGPSLRASQLVHCTPKDVQKAFIKQLYSNQKEWAYSKEFKEKLSQVSKFVGMDNEKFESCLADSVLEKKVIDSRVNAEKAFYVNSTPTLIVNGQKYIGKLNAKDLSIYINNLIN
jgi:protein-disulfide isomerase